MITKPIWGVFWCLNLEPWLTEIPITASEPAANHYSLLVIVYQTDLDSIPKTGSRKKLETDIEKREGLGQFLSAYHSDFLGYAKFASYHVMVSMEHPDIWNYYELFGYIWY